jgi:hypothetical protein
MNWFGKRRGWIMGRREITYTGVKFGSALAMVISYTTHKSILWAIIHGLFGWLYVIYFALKIKIG